MSEGVRVEGIRELQRALRQGGRRDLQKEMGQANRRIGVEVIRRLQPLPETVGLGAGAKVRPSANARLVMLKAGGRHRDGAAPQAQWGKRFAPRSTPRPHIAGTAIRRFPSIMDHYLDAIEEVLEEIER